MKQWKKISLYLQSGFYILAGIMHFLNPDFYMKIMPPFIPFPMLMIYISGVAESALGIGLFVEKTRRLSAWGIIALLIAVFPANIYAYYADINLGAPLWVNLFRLPIQGLFIWWAYSFTKD